MIPMELRPLSVGETLDAAFKQYTRNFKTLLTISAVVMIPIGIIQLAVSATYGNVSFADLFDPVNPDQLPPGFIGYFGSALINGLLTGLAGLLVQGASIRVFADTYQGITGTTWSESLRFSASKAILVFATGLVASIVSGLGLLLCIVPGVWLWTSWYVAVPSLLVEDRKPFAALGRSFTLVKPRFWAVLGVGALAWLITVVISQVVGFVVSLAVIFPTLFRLAEGTDPTTGPVVAASSVAGTLVSIFTVPFLAAVAVSVYFDLRVRSEGYDLERMAQELDAVGGSPIPRDEATRRDPFGLEGPEPVADPDDPFGLDQPPDS